MTKVKNLPTLAELSGDVEKAFANDQFNLLVNQAPPDKWLKKHPLAKKKNAQGSYEPCLYLPIDKVEFLLRRIFQRYRIEVKDTKVMFQSVTVTVRVHYLNPVNLEWDFHDGVGAVGVQTDKGASAADLSAIKPDAVMKALPAAKSYAIKDACDHIGKLFGCDIGRDDTLEFTPGYGNKQDKKDDFKWVQDQLDLLNTTSEVQMYFEGLKEYHSDIKFQRLFKDKLNKLKLQGK